MKVEGCSGVREGKRCSLVTGRVPKSDDLGPRPQSCNASNCQWVEQSMYLLLSGSCHISGPHATRNPGLLGLRKHADISTTMEPGTQDPHNDSILGLLSL